MLVALLATLRVLPAALIFEEHFNYATGDLGQTLTANAWSRTGNGDSIQIVSGNLNHPVLDGSSGNMLQWGGGGRISRHDFPTVTSGDIYASLLLRIDNLGTLVNSGGSPIAGLVNAANTANPNSRLYVRRDGQDANAYNVGVYERGSTITWVPDKLYAGQTQFVVFSLSFVAGVNNDVARLWLNPLAASFGSFTAPTATVFSSGGEDAAQVNRFRLVQDATNGAPGLLTFDELRIGTTWADVTPQQIVPEPTTVAVALLGTTPVWFRRRRA